MKMKYLLCGLLCCIFSNPGFAQSFKVQENADSLKAWLQRKSHPIDPSAPVVILYEVGTSETTNGLISYRYEIAYKVFNAKDIGKLADISIPKVRSGTVRKIKGTTYNLEGNEPVASSIEKSDVIMDTYADDLELVKFSMPAIKDGSVVTYSYNYEYGNLPKTWEFQREFPVLYSRFDFNFPSKYLATPVVNSAVPVKAFPSIKKMDASNAEACSAEELLSYSNVTLRSWVRRNLPAFKEEDMMGSKSEYIEKVKVRLNGISTPGAQFHSVESWDNFSKEVLYDKVLIQAFQKNGFLKDTVSLIVKGKTDTLEQAKAIYYYVQKRIQQKQGEEDINKVFTGRQGDGLGINKLLCAMLRTAGIESDLIVLSQKGNEKLSQILPNPDDITNVIVRVVINNVSYVMDGSQKELPFGYLPTSYYNGYARIVNKLGGSVELSPSLAANTTLNTVYISVPKDKKDQLFRFKQNTEMGIYSGAAFRSAWKHDSATIKKTLLEQVQDEQAGLGLKLQNIYVDNINDVDQKVRLRLEGTIDFGKQPDMIFLDPYFSKIFRENPIKDAKNRKYPIEFEYLEQNNYKLYVLLNDEYEFDDYPMAKQFAFGNPANLVYTNKVSVDTAQNQMLLQCRFENATTHLDAAEAQELRNFYNDIIKSQTQKIVIKRKGNNHVEN